MRRSIGGGDSDDSGCGERRAEEGPGDLGMMRDWIPQKESQEIGIGFFFF